jgi:hypothetical protein
MGELEGSNGPISNESVECAISTADAHYVGDVRHELWGLRKELRWFQVCEGTDVPPSKQTPVGAERVLSCLCPRSQLNDVAKTFDPSGLVERVRCSLLCAPDEGAVVTHTANASIDHDEAHVMYRTAHADRAVERWVLDDFEVAVPRGHRAVSAERDEEVSPPCLVIA